MQECRNCGGGECYRLELLSIYNIHSRSTGYVDFPDMSSAFRNNLIVGSLLSIRLRFFFLSVSVSLSLSLSLSVSVSLSNDKKTIIIKSKLGPIL